MNEIGGRSGPATSQAVGFAQRILDGAQAAFYSVDGNMNMKRFLLSGVSADFHREYVAEMSNFDPLHARNATGQAFALLSRASECRPGHGTSRYSAFIADCGISDMVELFFRRRGKVVAGMSIGWKHPCRVPNNALDIAARIHGYLEFNLVGHDTAVGDASGYGLTARELEVVELLCCGRTNREISVALGIGLPTVKTHLIHIFEKLGAETRSAVVSIMSRRRS